MQKSLFGLSPIRKHRNRHTNVMSDNDEFGVPVSQPYSSTPVRCAQRPRSSTPLHSVQINTASISANMPSALTPVRSILHGQSRVSALANHAQRKQHRTETTGDSAEQRETVVQHKQSCASSMAHCAQQGLVNRVDKQSRGSTHKQQTRQKRSAAAENQSSAVASRRKKVKASESCGVVQKVLDKNKQSEAKNNSEARPGHREKSSVSLQGSKTGCGSGIMVRQRLSDIREKSPSGSEVSQSSKRSRISSLLGKLQEQKHKARVSGERKRKNTKHRSESGDQPSVHTLKVKGNTYRRWPCISTETVDFIVETLQTAASDMVSQPRFTDRPEVMQHVEELKSRLQQELTAVKVPRSAANYRALDAQIKTLTMETREDEEDVKSLDNVIAALDNQIEDKQAHLERIEMQLQKPIAA